MMKSLFIVFSIALTFLLLTSYNIDMTLGDGVIVSF